MLWLYASLDHSSPELFGAAANEAIQKLDQVSSQRYLTHSGPTQKLGMILQSYLMQQQEKQ